MIKTYILKDPMILLGKLIDCPHCGKVLKVVYVDSEIRKEFDGITGREEDCVYIKLSDGTVARFFLTQTLDENDERAEKIERGMNGGW